MTNAKVQDYCDWCFRALTEPSRERSRWLGMTTQDAWACEECLETGVYRTPPDGWDAPEEAWLARDEYLLHPDDVTVLLGALDEVLHGPAAVDEREFATRLGVTRAQALETVRRLRGGTPT